MIKIYVNMPTLTDKRILAAVKRDIDLAEDDVIVIMDWHRNEGVFHAPPPHLEALLTKKKIPDSGLGYAPFGWVKGWVWMRQRIADILESAPYGIQYGMSPHIRNGWGFNNNAREPDVAAYNDTCGILKEALDDSPYWPELIVIPETQGSNIQKRGVQRVKEFFNGEVMLEQDVEATWWPEDEGEEEGQVEWDDELEWGDGDEEEPEIYWVPSLSEAEIDRLIKLLMLARGNVINDQKVAARNRISRAIRILKRA